MSPRSHAFHSPWCDLMRHWLTRRNLSQERFAYLVGKKQGAIAPILLGKQRPPLELLPSWADALKLYGHDREQFLWLAMQPWTPDPVWERVTELEELLRRCREQVAEQSKRLSDA